MEAKCEQTKTVKYPNRWKKGVSGNPAGTPRKPEIDILRQALQKAKEENGMDFIEHFVRMAYKDKIVAVALARKLIPDKIQGEGFDKDAETKIYIIKFNKDGNRIQADPQADTSIRISN